MNIMGFKTNQKVKLFWQGTLKVMAPWIYAILETFYSQLIVYKLGLLLFLPIQDIFEDFLNYVSFGKNLNIAASWDRLTFNTFNHFMYPIQFYLQLRAL